MIFGLFLVGLAVVVAITLILVIFMLVDFMFMWLEDRRLRDYSRSDEELLEYPRVLKSVDKEDQE